MEGVKRQSKGNVKIKGRDQTNRKKQLITMYGNKEVLKILKILKVVLKVW